MDPHGLFVVFYFQSLGKPDIPPLFFVVLYFDYYVTCYLFVLSKNNKLQTLKLSAILFFIINSFNYENLD
jgi:hypothetical protein